MAEAGHAFGGATDVEREVPMSVGRRRDPAEKYWQCLVLQLDRRCEIDLASPASRRAGTLVQPRRRQAVVPALRLLGRGAERDVRSVKGVDCSGTLATRRVDIRCCELFE